MQHQSVFIDLDSVALSAEEIQLLKLPVVTGVILFSRNCQTASQLKGLIQEIRSIRPELIISMDQEGGRVQRLKEGVTKLPAVSRLAYSKQLAGVEPLEAASQLGFLMAYELLELGVDLSFSPVLDVDYGRNDVIGDRAFAKCAADVTPLAVGWVSGMRHAGMAAVVKHFPGHGWADADTHLDVARDERSFADIEREDLAPFAQLIDQQVAAVMPAHVIYGQCDPSPAGFSEFWLQKILRQKLGFQGLVFSDDLTMQAVAKLGGYPKRAEAALLAGCNILLACNNREGLCSLIDYMMQACSGLNADLKVLRGQPSAQSPLLRQRLEVARSLAEKLN